MTGESPPPTPAPATTSTTKTESTTVKTVVGDVVGGEPAVVIMTQSKIALINQGQASFCAVVFTITLCLGFLKPWFVGGEPLLTSGELIGVASGVITGAALTNRGGTRAADVVRATPTPASTAATGA